MRSDPWNYCVVADYFFNQLRQNYVIELFRNDEVTLIHISTTHKHTKQEVYIMVKHEILKATVIIMALAGLFILFGTAGASDCADAIGNPYPVSTLLRQIGIGVALIFPALMTFGE